MITQDILDILDGSDYPQSMMDAFEGSALNDAVVATIDAMRDKGWSYVEKRGGFINDEGEPLKFAIVFVNPPNDRTFYYVIEDMN